MQVPVVPVKLPTANVPTAGEVKTASAAVNAQAVAALAPVPLIFAPLANVRGQLSVEKVPTVNVAPETPETPERALWRVANSESQSVPSTEFIFPPDNVRGHEPAVHVHVPPTAVASHAAWEVHELLEVLLQTVKSLTHLTDSLVDSFGLPPLARVGFSSAVYL